METLVSLTFVSKDLMEAAPPQGMGMGRREGRRRGAVHSEASSGGMSQGWE